MSTEIIACPNCGNRKFAAEIPLAARTVLCPACRVQFVTELGRRLALRSESETRKLDNLNRQLLEAIAHDNVDAILSRSEEILAINPEDYAARYYFAYGKRRRSEAGFIGDFYAAPVSEVATEEAVRGIVNHMIQHSEFGDWRRVDAYIQRTSLPDTDPLLALYKRTYDERLQKESDYLDCERDVFVCHSSENAAKVESILAMLEDQGRTVWVSSRNLRPNDSENYWRAIGRAIHSCRVILLVYSIDASRSQDVMRELEMAYREKKRIVEINLDGTPHKQNSIFDRVLDGNSWVDASANFKSGVADLGDRLFKTLLNLPTPELAEDEAPEPTAALADYEPSYENGRLLLEKGLVMGLGEEYLKAAYRLFFITAREENDPRAWFGVGLCHYYGYGVEKNEDKGNHIFGEYYSPICALAEGGDAEAAYILYEYLAEALDLYEDKAGAVEWLQKAAELGSLRAAYTLSCEYTTDNTVALLQRAYEGHFHLATYAWASCLFRGYHLMDDDGRRLDAPNRNGAVRVYHDGASEGDPRCRRRLEETHLHKKGFEIFEGVLLSLTDQWQTSVRDGVLTIPSAVSEVAPMALAKATGVDAVQFPDAVTSLPTDAFGDNKVPALRGAGLATEVGARLRRAKKEAAAEEKRQARARHAECRRERRERRREKAAVYAANPTVWLILIAIATPILCILAGVLGFFRLPDAFMCIWYALAAFLAVIMVLASHSKAKKFCDFSIRQRGFVAIALLLIAVLGFCFGGVINAKWGVLPSSGVLVLTVVALFVTYSGRSRLTFVFPVSAVGLSLLVPIHGGVAGLLPVFTGPMEPGSNEATTGGGTILARMCLFVIIGFVIFFAFSRAYEHCHTYCVKWWCSAILSLCLLAFVFIFCFCGLLPLWISWPVFLAAAAGGIVTIATTE